MRFLALVFLILALASPARSLPPQKAERFIKAARELIGVRYELGGRLRIDGEGIDCQGVLFYAAERLGPCGWKSFSVMPTKSVARQELGRRVPGLDPVASSELLIDKLQPGDVILFVDFMNNPAEPAIGKIDGEEVWVWHTGLYSGNGNVIEADLPGVVETNLVGLLSTYSYAGVFVTRMSKGPKPRRCRRHPPMPKPTLDSLLMPRMEPIPTKAG